MSPRLAETVQLVAVRDEGTAYIRHPLRVALVLTEELGVRDGDLIVAALPHDVLEDSDQVTFAELAQHFGARAADLILRLTDELKTSELSHAEHNLTRIATEGDDCFLVKLCDRLDNVRSLRFVSNPTKRASIARDTRAYLMPSLSGRRSHIPHIAGAISRELSTPLPHGNAHMGLLRNRK